MDSLLFSSVRVYSYGCIESSVLLPEVEVGRSCRIRKAVIDRGCQIPRETVIGEDPVADAKQFRVTRKGVVLVTAAMLGQESTVSHT